MTCDSTVSESCCDGAHTSCRGKVAVGNTSDNLHIRTCTCKCHETATSVADSIRPLHYGGADNPHETRKCLAAWGLIHHAYRWNVVKYVARAGRKDPAQMIDDLKEARQYLDWEIERLEQKG